MIVSSISVKWNDLNEWCSGKNRNANSKQKEQKALSMVFKILNYEIRKIGPELYNKMPGFILILHIYQEIDYV